MNIDNVFRNIFGLNKPVIVEKTPTGHVDYDPGDVGKSSIEGVPLITDAMIQGSNPAERFAVAAAVPGRWSAALPMPIDCLSVSRPSNYFAAAPPAPPPPGYKTPRQLRDKDSDNSSLESFKNRSLGADAANRSTLISQELY